MDFDRVIQGDCIEWLNQAKADGPFADLIFADPPFNIGYKYDVYEDSKAYDDYHQWTRDWMAGCAAVLKPTGSFWVAIGDEYAAEVRMIGRDLGLTLRNWVIWHYTFGQQTKAKFARSHAHLFYFVADPTNFTFNNQLVRTFSDRQRVYRDKRANKQGKLPDDTWNEFPRVCGTFGEREGWHPCQMPEQVLTRIVRASSNLGDVVFDPFAGSGTTLVAAKRQGRRYLGTELSPEYVKQVRKRLDAVRPLSDTPTGSVGAWPMEHEMELKWLYLEASVSSDWLHENPAMLAIFAEWFNARLAGGGWEGRYQVDDIWQHLEILRRGLELPKVRVHAEEPVRVKPRPTPSRR